MNRVRISAEVYKILIASWQRWCIIKASSSHFSSSWKATIWTVMRKPAFCHMWTTKVQISLPIRAIWSAPLLLAVWIVEYLQFLYWNFRFLWLCRPVCVYPGCKPRFSHDEAHLSHLMRLLHFSSSLNSFFKRMCAAIQWCSMSDFWSDPSSTSTIHVCEQERPWRDCTDRLCDKYHNLMSWLIYICGSSCTSPLLVFQEIVLKQEHSSSEGFWILANKTFHAFGICGAKILDFQSGESNSL